MYEWSLFQKHRLSFWVMICHSKKNNNKRKSRTRHTPTTWVINTHLLTSTWVLHHHLHHPKRKSWLFAIYPSQHHADCPASALPRALWDVSIASSPNGVFWSKCRSLNLAAHHGGVHFRVTPFTQLLSPPWRRFLSKHQLLNFWAHRGPIHLVFVWHLGFWCNRPK
jgi:hypothetical protein